MNRETQEALERLSRELLAEDTPEEEMPEDDFLDGLDELLADADDIADDPPEVYRNFSNGYGRSVRAYNADRTDRDTLSDELEEPERRRSAAPLLVPLVLLFAAAVALAWWAVKYL